MPSGHIAPTAALKPLSAHAWGWLAHLSREPVPCYMINAGVADRFRREGLVDQVGKSLVITAAGVAKLLERP